ncbi:serine hydrolase domain-containing protein [Streptomyces alboflavus]|uniref:Beta-lactamase-related domain-containing protein n=1 Tax=Streptomyces alboflavus TaxID=67267 RepID=A0A1Z1WCS4_9ACTN|nr:hypothetical protein SMD44_03693 [Streptomyces alboflavus]
MLAATAGTAVTGSAFAAGRTGRAPRGDGDLAPLDPAALRAATADLSHPRATAAHLRVADTGAAGGAGGSGTSWYGTSGVADLTTGRKVGRHDRFRIGSITKVFVATVVLQLAHEGRVHLHAPVQRYLPGLLPDTYAPVRITHLLTHTSGLPSESGPDVPDLSTPEATDAHRHDRWTPERLLATVTREPRTKFRPGSAQEYRGMNYVLLALLIRELTGRSHGAEIHRRVARPLGLTEVTSPGHDPRVHGPHVRGYLKMADGRLKDFTEYDQSYSWGEGELISTGDDLDRFLAALFAGRLLPPHLLRLMHTLPPKEVRMLDGSPARYGAGLQTATVNGVELWGKTGEQYGYASAAFSTVDGRRRFVLAYNPVGASAAGQPTMTQRVAEVVTRRRV